MRDEATKAGAVVAPARVGVAGTIYLLCFGEGGLHVAGNRYARHYIGWTEGDVKRRLEVHLTGNGSPLVRAADAAGCLVKLARTWPGDRNFERKLKDRHDAPKLCPLCCEREGRTPREAAPQ